MLAKETGLTALLFNVAFDLYRCWGSLNRLMTFCYLAAFNWWLLLCPWTLSHDWQMGSVPLVTSVWDSRNLLTCAAVLSLLALLYKCVVDLEVHFIGFVLITLHGVQMMWNHDKARRWLLVGITILVAGGAAKTYVRNRDWRTRESLLRLWPSYASAHNNLGTLVMASGRAEHHFLQALKYNRDHVNAHYNLAKLYRKKNRIADALKMLERCIALEPRFVQAYLELFLVTEDRGKQKILDKLSRVLHVDNVPELEYNYKN
ncbi:unnamed protein product [Leptidea sinapis]|uniref:dolichyl-phosphate-mannose--protein mannosyltransferase n=1 Tax=Leptidea sinapis TaxID=189913 RepID=A0A5E4Q214_9NEOP|nr:unnamed protein product [Leptidea sinapis]